MVLVTSGTGLKRETDLGQRIASTKAKAGGTASGRTRTRLSGSSVQDMPKPDDQVIACEDDGLWQPASNSNGQSREVKCGVVGSSPTSLGRKPAPYVGKEFAQAIKTRGAGQI